MEFWQLRTFQVVAETLNFTRAAERLKMTQSAVSHQMKALEDEIGESLFVRARRGVKLSGAGQAMLEHAQRILEEVDALREHVAGRRRGPTGRVRAAAATQAFAYLFAPLCEAFVNHYPGIDVSFVTAGSTAQTVASIQAGEAHVGIASLPDYTGSLSATDLFSDELLAVVPSAHPLARGKVVAASRLRGEPVVLFEQGSSIRHLTDGFMKRARWAPRVALESNDLTFIKLMVAHGRGMSFLPPWAVRDEVLSGRLAMLRIEHHRLRRTVAMIALARFQSAALRALLEFMIDHRPQLQWMAEGHTTVRLRERPGGPGMWHTGREPKEETDARRRRPGSEGEVGDP